MPSTRRSGNTSDIVSRLYSGRGVGAGPADAFITVPEAGDATGFYRQLSRYSSAFALGADMALLTLGGALKRKEMLSARFGDILSELYLLSAALKRWQDEGRQPADFAALEWCMASGFRTIEMRFAEILANLPNRFVAAILKFLIQPFGARVLGPSDRVTHRCAQIVLEPSAARDRLTPDLSRVDDDGGVARLEKAFALVTGAANAAKQLRAARLHDWREAVKQGVITQAEGEKLSRGPRGRRKSHRSRRLRAGSRSPIYKKPADMRQFFRHWVSEGGELMARKVYIVDGSRTPFLKARWPRSVHPRRPGSSMRPALLARQPFVPDAFDQVILGSLIIADEMNPARVAALRLGMGRRWWLLRCRSIAAPACNRSTRPIATSAKAMPIDSRRRLGSTELRTAGVAAAGCPLVCRIGWSKRHWRQNHRGVEGTPGVFQADHWPRTRIDRSDH